MGAGTLFAVEHTAFHVDLFADPLSLWFAALTSALSGIVAAFSHRYMHRERGYNRFFVLFATFMGADPEVARYWNAEIFLFPVVKEVLADPAVLDLKYDFYGGQPVNQVFAEASDHVDPSFEFAPFQDYVNTHIQDELAAAIGGNGTLAEAFDRVQDAIVAYATDQGYTVV